MATKRYRADSSHAGFNDSRVSIADGNVQIGVLDGLQELSVSDSLEMGDEREVGSPFVEDVVTGDYSAEGSAVWKAEAWDRLVKKLAARCRGVFGTKFNLTWTYECKDKTITTIVITDVYFKKRERQGKLGSEALKVNIDLHIKGRVYENGVDAFGNPM